MQGLNPLLRFADLDIFHPFLKLTKNLHYMDPRITPESHATDVNYEGLSEPVRIAFARATNWRRMRSEGNRFSQANSGTGTTSRFARRCVDRLMRPVVASSRPACS